MFPCQPGSGTKVFFKNEEQTEQVSTGRALRQLVRFQIKLALDAIRDLLLSPISLVVFIIDAVRKPPVQDSLYLRLMRAGRQSDRLINLFNEYSETDHYTVDETIAEMERVVSREVEKERQRKLSKGSDEAQP